MTSSYFSCIDSFQSILLFELFPHYSFYPFPFYQPPCPPPLLLKRRECNLKLIIRRCRQPCLLGGGGGGGRHVYCKEIYITNVTKCGVNAYSTLVNEGSSLTIVNKTTSLVTFSELDILKLLNNDEKYRDLIRWLATYFSKEICH